MREREVGCENERGRGVGGGCEEFGGEREGDGLAEKQEGVRGRGGGGHGGEGLGLVNV